MRKKEKHWCSLFFSFFCFRFLSKVIKLQANFTLISKSWILVCTAAIDTMGEQYWGTVNVTINGRTCQRWDTTSPHNHSFLDLEVSNVSAQWTLLINLIFNVKCTFGYNEAILNISQFLLILCNFSFENIRPWQKRVMFRSLE